MATHFLIRPLFQNKDFENAGKRDDLQLYKKSILIPCGKFHTHPKVFRRYNHRMTSFLFPPVLFDLHLPWLSCNLHTQPRSTAGEAKKVLVRGSFEGVRRPSSGETWVEEVL
ncbi:hypothetical protein QCA50_016153 [Cerrena zonata]|uniref:Uncharacterized protein n=1 Tax=Cerrena zonata TaxID=2478898 RepID=A0AAW0FGJ6_9APHY